jgi:hypothetical protein
MTITYVRYRTHPDRADENQALVEKVYAELAGSRPEGFRYLTVRLDDGVSFVHVADCAEGADNPLASCAAFAEFQREIADRCEEGPVATQGTLVGSYGFGTGPA